jgi:hypothetical protein
LFSSGMASPHGRLKDNPPQDWVGCQVTIYPV